VGICGQHGLAHEHGASQPSAKVCEKEDISTEGAKFYSPRAAFSAGATLFQRPVVGKNWALVGDAARLVDPLTGEGLFYAIRSGELLGAPWPPGARKNIRVVKAAFSTELEFAARIVRRFYRGRFSKRVRRGWLQFLCAGGRCESGHSAVLTAN